MFSRLTPANLPADRSWMRVRLFRSWADTVATRQENQKETHGFWVPSSCSSDQNKFNPKTISKWAKKETQVCTPSPTDMCMMSRFVANKTQFQRLNYHTKSVDNTQGPVSPISCLDLEFDCCHVFPKKTVTVLPVATKRVWQAEKKRNLRKARCSASNWINKAIHQLSWDQSIFRVYHATTAMSWVFFSLVQLHSEVGVSLAHLATALSNASAKCFFEAKNAASIKDVNMKQQWPASFDLAWSRYHHAKRVNAKVTALGNQHHQTRQTCSMAW